MGLFENFPYTNFHELNLGWLLQKVKEMDAKDAIMEAQIKALEEWLQQQNIEQMVEDVLQEMLDNGDFNDIVAQVLGVVITPQALGFPGTKTADEVFAIMETFTINPIAIPAATYTLTDTYYLKNVIADEGTYDGFVPLYKRDKNFDLMGFSAGEHITLPIADCYIEGAAYLNGSWYVAAYCYNESYDYLIKYDSSFTQQLLTQMTRPPADLYSYHASRNVYTDGTSIYVDFTSNTYKYDPSTLALQAMYTHSQVSTDYFNGSFWGVAYSGTAFLISKLNNDFTVASTQVVDCMVARNSEQNCTFHNGLIYLPALPGDVNVVIDMYDWSFNNIYYQDQMEIEKIAFKGDTPVFFGHTIGIMGQFQVGEYNGGNPTNYFGRYTFDGSSESINLSTVNKFGVYDFTNMQIGTIGNSGKLFIIDDVIYARVGNYLMVRNSTNGGWRLAGADRAIAFTVDTNIFYRIEPNGHVYLDIFGLEISTANATTTISYDSSFIFELCGLGAGSDFSGVVFGRSDQSPNPYNGFGAMTVTVTRTAIYLRPVTLVGTPAKLYIHGHVEPRFTS